jgi:hypothetical protein
MARRKVQAFCASKCRLLGDNALVKSDVDKPSLVRYQANLLTRLINNLKVSD